MYSFKQAFERLLMNEQYSDETLSRIKRAMIDRATDYHQIAAFLKTTLCLSLGRPYEVEVSLITTRPDVSMFDFDDTTFTVKQNPPSFEVVVSNSVVAVTYKAVVTFDAARDILSDARTRDEYVRSVKSHVEFGVAREDPLDIDVMYHNMLRLMLNQNMPNCSLEVVNWYGDDGSLSDVRVTVTSKITNVQFTYMVNPLDMPYLIRGGEFFNNFVDVLAGRLGVLEYGIESVLTIK